MFRSTSEMPGLAHGRVTLRHSGVGDVAQIHRLAALDSARAPHGPLLVAESDARIVAALPLGSGRPIADPFEPSAELVELLRLRAEQLDTRDHPRRTGMLARLRARFA